MAAAVAGCNVPLIKNIGNGTVFVVAGFAESRRVRTTKLPIGIETITLSLYPETASSSVVRKHSKALLLQFTLVILVLRLLLLWHRKRTKKAEDGYERCLAVLCHHFRMVDRSNFERYGSAS